MKEKDLSRHVARGDRLIREHVHDPYKTRLKLTEPTVCQQCGAVYHEGRWHWAERPDQAQETLCQACHRTNDGYPAGILTLSGTFVGEHKTEILGLARHQEELEKGEHPLHRIMNIDEQGKVIVINTTDIHLPRRIGEALHNAYEGELDFHYDEESYLIRVSWRRDD
ncbi:MAG: BCAM0308 family protein [Rhodospirillales bacterium]|nr:BCAM0308 family protein [Rhodospirillales bacterium]